MQQKVCTSYTKSCENTRSPVRGQGKDWIIVLIIINITTRRGQFSMNHKTIFLGRQQQRWRRIESQHNNATVFTNCYIPKRNVFSIREFLYVDEMSGWDKHGFWWIYGIHVRLCGYRRRGADETNVGSLCFDCATHLWPGRCNVNFLFLLIRMILIDGKKKTIRVC